ncbi:MAG: PilZ domain-containing protein [Gemmataceae bacterium]|nr:PilZ domain-containing protein [Gemmataceae bacterium]
MQEQTVHIRRPQAKDSRRVERRVAVRYPCKRRPIVRLLTRPSFVVRTALVCDISVNGMGLLLPEQIAPGTILAIHLRARNPGGSRVLSARVIHATPEVDGNWRIGCALSSRLTEEELREFCQDGP